MKFEAASDDSFRWSIDVQRDLRRDRTLDGQYIEYEAGPRTVEMTLYDVDQEEAKAVIALVNDMRRGVRTAQPEAPRPAPGGRFSNLDF